MGTRLDAPCVTTTSPESMQASSSARSHSRQRVSPEKSYHTTPGRVSSQSSPYCADPDVAIMYLQRSAHGIAAATKEGSPSRFGPLSSYITLHALHRFAQLTVWVRVWPSGNKHGQEEHDLAMPYIHRSFSSSYQLLVQCSSPAQSCIPPEQTLVPSPVLAESSQRRRSEWRPRRPEMACVFGERVVWKGARQSHLPRQILALNALLWGANHQALDEVF